MSNLIEIQSQIEKLQKQANEIKSREFDKTIQEILSKMTAYGITLKDLQPRKLSKQLKVRASKSGGDAGNVTQKTDKKKASGPVLPKYQGPGGETWSGRGLTPRWLSALVVQGKTREDFAIKS